MSVNPEILLIVGFDNDVVKGEFAVDGDDIYPGTSYNPYLHNVREDQIPKLEPKEYYDLLFYGSPMSYSMKKPGRYIGYVFERLDSYSWMARSVIQLPIANNMNCVFEMPLYEHYNEFDCTGRHKLEQVLAEHRNIVNFSGGYGLGVTDIAWEFAIRVINSAGIQIKRTDMKMYLIMDWS